MFEQSHVIESLPILTLFPHSRCNCRCVMCDIWKITTAEEISAADVKRHLEDIEALGVRWVVFSGGEPLMHSDLFRLARLLGSGGIRTTILTTGLLLERDAARIVESIDDVIVSLDGPPKIHDQIRRVRGAFENLRAGVDALREFDPSFPIAARTSVQRLNHAYLGQTADTAKALGLDAISFLAADLVSSAFNRPDGWPIERQVEVALSKEQIDVLEAEVERVITHRPQDIDAGFIRESPEKLRRIVHHFRAHLGLVEPIAPQCNAPWVSAVVEADGTLRPCFFHQPLGNVTEKGLRQVINAPEAVRFREDLDVATNPVCRRRVCSLYLPLEAADETHALELK